MVCFPEPGNQNAKKNIQYFKLEKQKLSEETHTPSTQEQWDEIQEYMETYQNLCRGKVTKVCVPSDVEFCLFVSRNNHGTRLSSDAVLGMFVNFLGNNNVPLILPQPQVKTEKLSCYYSNKHPLLILKPAKIEMANEDPDIFLLHDILLDGQMRRVREISSPRVSSLAKFYRPYQVNSMRIRTSIRFRIGNASLVDTVEIRI